MALRGIMLLAAGALLVSACAPAAPGSAAGASGPAAPDSQRLVASGQKFDRAALALPAGRPFTLIFDNRDTLPHNVSLRDASGGGVFTGEVFTGPGQRMYAIGALQPGTYDFVCDVHPEMKGTATAG